MRSSLPGLTPETLRAQHGSSAPTVPPQDRREQSAVYRLLWEAGSCLLEAQDAASAEALFTAAYQYAGRAAERCKAARVLAMCNLRQGQPRRASEYAEMAARQEAAPALATALLRLQAAMQLGDHGTAEKGGCGVHFDSLGLGSQQQPDFD